MKKIFLLGFFDSIHIGHRFLFDIAQKEAQKGDAIFVTTFDDGFLHSIGRKEDEIYLLEERKEIFRNIGPFEPIVFPSERNFIQMDKERFFEYLLRYSPDEIIVGKDYRFGKNAEGNVVDLENFFDDKNVKIIISDFLCYKGKKVSSSNIKEYLYSGEIEEANYLLKDPFFYTGIVKSGRKDGREMGIPTMNILIPNHKIQIKSGVYVTETVIDGNTYLSVTNVGAHPTFGDNSINIETHLIGEKIEAYDKKIKIVFYKYIRDIIRFDDKKELSKQIQKDIIFAKEVRKNDQIRRCGK